MTEFGGIGFGGSRERTYSVIKGVKVTTREGFVVVCRRSL